MSRTSARTVRPLRKSRKGNGLTVSARAQATSRDCDVVSGVDVRAEAADLLACLASQPFLSDVLRSGGRGLTTADLIIRSVWGVSVADAAALAWSEVYRTVDVGEHLDAAEHYAEAEARLREQVARGG